MQQDQSQPEKTAQAQPMGDATTSPVTPLDYREETPSGDVKAAMNTMAQQLSEEPTRLRKRQDVTQVLEKMTDGVIVTLHISRPRFSASIAPKRGSTFGLEKLGIVNSKDAQEVVREYFSLGRHSLLPTDLQKSLANIENSARACLDRFSFKTHWGYFVPTKNYKEWKEANEKFQRDFEEKKQYVLDHYDEIMEQVFSAYRTLANDAWMQTSFGVSVVRDNKDTLSQELLNGLYQRLEAGEGKEEFIQKYLSFIQTEIPTREEIAEAFEYETELGYIPLPSLLARDMDEADHVVRERTLRDAKLKAELDAIEAKRRAELDTIQEEQRLKEAKRRTEWQKLNERQRTERQAAYLKLQVEEEKLRAEQAKINEQRAMDRDIINSARKQKDQLVQEFYAGVIGQINQLIQEVCEETLESLDQHDGTLRGPVSARLGNLVKRLKNLNFIEDKDVNTYIQRIEAILPTQTQRDEAKRGIARIETNGIRKVVAQIRQEAEQSLIELGQSPMPRSRRQIQETQKDGAMVLDEPRNARRSLDFNKTAASGTRRRLRGSLKI